VVKKRLSTDHEFQHFALGSNEETIIYEEEYPEYTGGHIDTDERRMISNIGCEDCVGALYQWQLDQSYSYQGGTHTHPGGAAVDPKPPWR
jgi:hypothetical protein